MIATIPASAIVEDGMWRTGIAGTIWDGEAGLAGGSRLTWSWAPLRSLTSLGFAVDWRATGANTNLGGRALIGPTSATIDAMSGSADGTLLQAIQPDLPFTCDMTMQVEFPRVKLGGADQSVAGTLTTDAGSCAPKKGGAPATVAPLLLTAEHVGTISRMRLVPATQRRRTLMTITLSENGTVEVTMTPEGATALPFVGLPGGASIRGEI